MSRRDKIQMTEAELRKFLEEAQTITIVSNGPDGYPHPIPMWFALDSDGSIRMTTYQSSQKVKNIERDPRVSLLVESGTVYAELRGVVLYGEAELVSDVELAIDTALEASADKSASANARQNPDVREAMVKQMAKRVVIRIKPTRLVSWDHGKLGGVY